MNKKSWLLPILFFALVFSCVSSGNKEASGELKTVEVGSEKALFNVIRAMAKDSSKVKLNGTTVELYKDINVNKNFNIPYRTKLQVFNQMDVQGTIAVNGNIQDSRKPEDRTGGLVGEGAGAIEIRFGGMYYQQGNEIVGPAGIFQLSLDSSIQFLANNEVIISAGTVTLTKAITSDLVSSIKVSDDATFNFNPKHLADDISFTPPSIVKRDLRDELRYAAINVEATVSDVDGATITDDQLWVTEEAKVKYRAVIDSSLAIKESLSSTEDDYIAAYNAIMEATKAFNDSKKRGAVEAPVIETAEQLLKFLETFYDGDAPLSMAIYDELVGIETMRVIHVLQPITINRDFTVPKNVRLKFTVQMTLNAQATIYGHWQDFRPKGVIMANGGVGENGIGSVKFEPSGRMYIMLEGECIGPTGKIRLADESNLVLYSKNVMHITKGSAEVYYPLAQAQTSDITVDEGATLTIKEALNKEVKVASNGTYIDATVKNNEEKLNIKGETISSSDDSVVSAKIIRGRVQLAVNTNETKSAIITITDKEGLTASIYVDAKNGAIAKRTIVKHGQISAIELKATVNQKIQDFEKLVAEAESKGFDIEREKGVIWFAKEFAKYADWDDENIEVNQRMFALISNYRPDGKNAQDLAEELAGFERTEIINMIDDATDELNAVIAGEIVRRDVRMVDWEGIEHKGSNFYSNGKPVFLHDYFSKPLDMPTDDPTLFNDYLGNIINPASINPSFVSDDNGTPVQSKYDNLRRSDSKAAGYQILWHDPAPAWAVDKYGEDLLQGKSNFTKYDINSPVMRDIWSNVLKKAGPYTQGWKSNELGYMIANEPHWFVQDRHWASIKKTNGIPGMSQQVYKDFATWLENRHKTLSAMNNLWSTNFKSFEEASNELLPLDITYRNSPLWYDVCLFNMERGTDWLTFIHDELLKYNPEATTHIKIMPDLFSEGNRTHGINVEALTEMTEMIGDDAKTRKENFRKSGASEDWNKEFSYFWQELAVSYDFMHSVSPEKAHVNSEAHFLSTVLFRDLYMTPAYVRNTFWYATILGMDASFSWFWGRQPDGSIENRLLTTTNTGLLESYPASVAQQPRVANEVSKTMMDLNAFSEEIVQFQEQAKPARLFYSETAAINDNDYMEHMFGLYKKMNFEGIPLGYVTKNIIEKQDNSTWDVVAIYHTPNVTDAEFDAVQAYLNNGGTIIIDDKSLTEDEYKRPRNKKLTAGSGKIINAAKDTVTIAEQVLAEVKSVNRPAIKITEENGLDQKGAFWRVIPNGNGGSIVTIVNLGKNSATLKIEDLNGKSLKAVNMLTQQDLGSTFSIKPEGTMLLEVKGN